MDSNEKIIFKKPNNQTDEGIVTKINSNEVSVITSIRDKVTEIVTERVEKVAEKVAEEVSETVSEKLTQNVTEKVAEEVSETVCEPKTVLPEPMTKLLPPNDHYFIDQLKNGTIVEHKLITKSRIVFGRARDCDVVLEHPSISRYHAILLWSPIDDNQYQSGTNTDSFWYLIDCGSTHGTLCNKVRVNAGKLIKLIPNNNVFKFGASTRFFTLGSIDEQLEDDSNQTVVTKVNKSLNKTVKTIDTGCDWGINEDELEGDNEETADSKSLQAIIAAMKANPGGEGLKTANDNVYSANPNKCLQQWFEREGYDMDYKTDSIHNKFKCTFDLPIDGQWIPVESSLMHKKKEAITDACLKCCQLLDKAELLYPWQQHRDGHRRKRNDNDSDDNDMIDETVSLSKKKHKRDSDSNTNQSFDNFETLNQKWTQINEELCQTRVKFGTIGSQNCVKPVEESDDSLDNYMSTIGKQKYGLSMSDKILKSNLKIKINQLEKELLKLEKLINLAKPSVDLTLVFDNNKSLKVNTNTTDTKSKSETNTTDTKSKSETNTTFTRIETVIDKNDNKIVTESPVITIDDSVGSELSKPEITVDRNLIIAQKTELIINEMKVKTNDKKTKSKTNAQSIVEAIEKEKQLENKSKTKAKSGFDDDYVDWLPPSGQSGDGKTSLNEKFGY